MKRFIVFLLTVLMVALFVSCDGSPSTESDVDVALSVAIADNSNTKAIVSMVPMAEYYNVFLDNGSEPILHFGCTSEAEKGTSFEEKLKPGRHTIVVYAYNTEDKIIGKGEQSFTVNKNSVNNFEIDVVVGSYYEGGEEKTVSVQIKHATAVEASNIKVSIDEGDKFNLNSNKKYVFQNVEQGNHIFSLFYGDECIFKTVIKKTADPLNAVFSIKNATVNSNTVYLVKSENQSSDSSEIEVVAGTHFKAGSSFQIEIEDYAFSFTGGVKDPDPENKPIVEVYCLQQDFVIYENKGKHSGWYVEQYNNERDYRINVKCSKLPTDLEGEFTISVVIKYGENHEKVWSIERDFYVFPDDGEVETIKNFNKSIYSRPAKSNFYRCPYCLKGNATSFTHDHSGFKCENCGSIVGLMDYRERIIHNCIAGIYCLEGDKQEELFEALGLEGQNLEMELRVPANYEDVLYKMVVVKDGDNFVAPNGSNGHKRGFFFITCKAGENGSFIVAIEGFTKNTIDVSFYGFSGNVREIEDDIEKYHLYSGTFKLKDENDWFNY